MNHDTKRWLMYGAYGYTGALVLDLAVAAGHRPILAGRNADKLAPLAEKHGLESRAFSVDNDRAVREALRDVHVVLNCAGPFVDTADLLVRGCIEAGAHYADVTGEFMVIEDIARLDTAAKDAGVLLCPAVGFDVVPTDCLAAQLHAELPDATRLTLALQSDMGVSKGSAKSVLALFAEGPIIRRDGELARVSRRKHTRRLDYGKGPMVYAPVPWGDLITAWKTTGIPNIDVLVPLRAGAFELWIEPIVRRAFQSPWVRARLTSLIDRKLEPPSQQQLDEVGVLLFGEVENDRGERRAAVMECPNGYALTAEAAFLTVRRLLEHRGEGGFVTPSQLVGAGAPEKELGCTTRATESFSG
jgi:short subunit dehydrogenase-like uncharacterized protein